jgi:hypothetical protein
MNPVTGEMYEEDRWGGGEDLEDRVEEKRVQLGVKIDNAMKCVCVVCEERTKGLRVNTGNMRNGWSVMCAKAIANVHELVAIADEECGATPAKLKELMGRISKLSEVLDINLDCTGVSQSTISKYIKHTAKKFLSTMHGRTRNKLRRRGGAQIVQKAGAALVQGISPRVQKRTKHELLKHERNMENIRIAGKMRKYINSSLKRNESIGLSPHLTVSEVVREGDGEVRVDAKGKAVLQMVVIIYTDIVAHLKHKAERIRQWMSREGLVGGRKWMTDTESVPVEHLFYRHFVRTLHTGGPSGKGDSRGHGSSGRDCTHAILAGVDSGKG